MTTENILAPVAALALPDSAALTTKAERALAYIEAFEVKDNETYGFAAEELQAIKAKAKTLEDQRTSITGPINNALRAVNALFKGPGELLAKAEASLKGKMLAYSQEQERIAADARRKAEEAAAAERKRLADAAAEQQAEAQRQAEAAAAAQAAGDTQAAALAAAAAQRAQAEAAVSATTAQMVIAPVIELPKAAAKGISTTKQVQFEVTDLLALVKHIAERPELINLVVADSVKLRAYVRGLGTACQLPGVRVYEDTVMRSRSA